MTATQPPLADAATWSLLVRDAATGEVLLECESEVELSAASAPKLLLLVACAVLAEQGGLDLAEPLERSRVAPVGDSGIWQHLAQPTLAVGDAAMLVGAASDNLATNALLDRVGLDAVARVAADLGIGGVRLHDRVRDVRAETDPPRLGTASAAGLVDLLCRLEARALGSAAVSERVLGWMRHSLDLSMVASAFGLDPLSHGAGGGGLQVLNKTGTDAGVRVDAGLVRGRRRAVAYAALANWPAELDLVPAVLRDMRAIGDAVAAAAQG